MTDAARVALVTGAGGQIGSAIASALSRSGYRLMCADLASTFQAPDGAEIMACDVARAADVGRVVGATVERFGRLDVLVNAAGIVSFGSAATLAEAEWDHVLAINLKGTFLACQAAMPHLKASGSGRIINIGSVVGRNGGNARPWIDPAEQERAANVAYGVSKAGVHALTVALARELAAHRVTVNAIAPGPIETPMTTTFPAHLKALIPVGRMGRPDEVAHACLYLVSEAAGFVTGEILNLNGGMFPG